MRNLGWILTVLLLGGSCDSQVGAQEPAQWKAGVATVKITPQEAVWMAGYAARDRPSEGVAQDLFAKALALEDGRGQRPGVIGVRRKQRSEAARARVGPRHVPGGRDSRQAGGEPDQKGDRERGAQPGRAGQDGAASGRYRAEDAVGGEAAGVPRDAVTTRSGRRREAPAHADTVGAAREARDRGAPDQQQGWEDGVHERQRTARIVPKVVPPSSGGGAVRGPNATGGLWDHAQARRVPRPPVGAFRPIAWVSPSVVVDDVRPSLVIDAGRTWHAPCSRRRPCWRYVSHVAKL